MWQRVGGLLLVVLISSDGLRKQSKVASNSSLLKKQSKVASNSSLLKENTALDDDINSILEDLKDQPYDLVVDLITGLAEFDWNSTDVSVEVQMRNLIIKTSTDLVQTIAQAVHPILGTIFSIFAALIKRDGTNQESELVKQILEQVDLMITDYHVDHTVRSALETGAEVVNQHSASGNWDSLPDALLPWAVQVFSPCDSPSKTDNCKQVWEGRKSSEAMVYEIHFLQLMITSVAEIVRYMGKIDGLKNFMSRAEDMAQVAVAHFNTLNRVRREFDSNKHGLKRGKARCWGLPKSRECKVDGATDLWLSTTFCAQNTTKVPKWYPWSAKRDSMQDDHNECFEAHKAEIIEELAGFNKSTDAILNTAKAMVKAFQT